MIFVGHDWAEDHHDIVVLDEAGGQLAQARFPEGLAGIAAFAELVATHAGTAAEVVIGTETDRGLFIAAAVAASHEVYAINPKSVDRYRDRHRVARGKSDIADAKVLADLVRTDRHNHRKVALDSELAEALKVLARTHKNLCRKRQQHVNRLRVGLREYFPGALDAFGTDLADRDAVAVLAAAPTPAQARALSVEDIAGLLRSGGRKRYVDTAAAKIADAFAQPQPEAPALIADAYGAATAATVAVIAAMNTQIAALETQLATHFDQHPDAETYLRLPGLGYVLAARVLAEFGDDPNRYESAKARRSYAGTAPITRQSGKATLVTVRRSRNQHLADACCRWAFCSLAGSPGARAYYDAMRARNLDHQGAIFRVANRWVSILHHLLATGADYDETAAWANWLPAGDTGPTEPTTGTDEDLQEVA